MGVAASAKGDVGIDTFGVDVQSLNASTQQYRLMIHFKNPELRSQNSELQVETQSGEKIFDTLGQGVGVDFGNTLLVSRLVPDFHVGEHGVYDDVFIQAATFQEVLGNLEASAGIELDALDTVKVLTHDVELLAVEGIDLHQDLAAAVPVADGIEFEVSAVKSGAQDEIFFSLASQLCSEIGRQHQSAFCVEFAGECSSWVAHVFFPFFVFRYKITAFFPIFSHFTPLF